MVLTCSLGQAVRIHIVIESQVGEKGIVDRYGRLGHDVAFLTLRPSFAGKRMVVTLILAIS